MRLCWEVFNQSPPMDTWAIPNLQLSRQCCSEDPCPLSFCANAGVLLEGWTSGEAAESGAGASGLLMSGHLSLPAAPHWVVPRYAFSATSEGSPFELFDVSPVAPRSFNVLLILGEFSSPGPPVHFLCPILLRAACRDSPLSSS